MIFETSYLCGWGDNHLKTSSCKRPPGQAGPCYHLCIWPTMYPVLISKPKTRQKYHYIKTLYMEIYARFSYVIYNLTYKYYLYFKQTRSLYDNFYVKYTKDSQRVT